VLGILQAHRATGAGAKSARAAFAADRVEPPSGRITGGSLQHSSDELRELPLLSREAAHDGREEGRGVEPLERRRMAGAIGDKDEESKLRGPLPSRNG
jgi:hypothetical protein